MKYNVERVLGYAHENYAVEFVSNYINPAKWKQCVVEFEFDGAKNIFNSNYFSITTSGSRMNLSSKLSDLRHKHCVFLGLGVAYYRVEV